MNALDRLSGVETLGQADLVTIATQYLGARRLLDTQASQTSGRGEREYEDTNALWRAVVQGEPPGESQRIVLRRVWLSEWIPRSPGLYHTDYAAHLREQAKYFVIEKNEKNILYDPYGKRLMIDAGVGCLRLIVKEVGYDRLKFLSASSDGLAHAGFVVAMREEMFGEITQGITGDGGVFCEIRGRIRWWPQDQKTPITWKAGIPRLYLMADDVQPALVDRAKTKVLTATAAITFEGVVEGKKGRYFTFGSFNPGDRQDLRNCINWLERNYIQERYSGHAVLADFDEHERFFDNVRFSIKTLMDPKSTVGELTMLSTETFGISPEHAEKILVMMGQINLDLSQNKTVNMTYEGDKFENITNSIIATRGSIASGVIKVKEKEGEQVADALKQLEQAIGDVDPKAMTDADKEKALKLLEELTKQISVPNRSKVVLETIGKGLWEVIKNVEPITKMAFGAWSVLQNLWS